MIGGLPLLIKMGVRQIVVSGKGYIARRRGAGRCPPAVWFLACLDLRASGDLLDRML